MNSKAMFSIVLSGLALSGCASLRSGMGLPCTSQVCFVSVTVSGDCTNPSNVVIVPDSLPVGRDNRDPQIHWDIGTAGFTFAPVPRGIVITSPPPPPGEFHDPTLASNGTKYLLKNKNSSAQTYKYTVNLLKDGNACAPKDPFIVNGN